MSIERNTQVEADVDVDADPEVGAEADLVSGGTPEPDPVDHLPSGPAFWLAVVVGVGVMGWGVWLFLEATSLSELFDLGVWIVGPDVVVDWLVLPAVALVGVAVARWAPGWAKAPLQVGLIATGVLLLVAWLPLRGSGDHVGNPTIQPLDYSAAVSTTLVVVWTASIGWAAWRRQRTSAPRG